ncbi:OmpA family protein [Altererythrobacter aquiaggeris]|uniref:OmpA family protein n=1 Tax=Aestuarierythrobacter aquiaggeris TaxID=1898396 RepID=UPI00301806AE
MTRTIVIAAILGLSLSACDRAPRETEPETDETGAVLDEPEAQATASIFSPEAEIKGIPEILEPLNTTVTFPAGGDVLDSAAIEALGKVMASEQIAKGKAVVLGGHSDAGGTDAANLRAAQARADAVRDWLIARGVADDRIRVISFGEQNPVQPNALPDGSPNEKGRALNRRVDITVAIDDNAPKVAPSRPAPGG